MNGGTYIGDWNEKNGIWEKGTFQGGTWENGDFNGGTFASGTFNYGSFHGYWEHGTMNGGHWYGGRWHDNDITETITTTDQFGNTSSSTIVKEKGKGTWIKGYWHYGTW